MDGSPWIDGSREHLPAFAAWKIDVRLMVVTPDPTPGYMVLAFEHLNPGLKLVGLCSEEDEVLKVIEQTGPTHVAVCSDLERGDGASAIVKIKRAHPTIRTMLVCRSKRMGKNLQIAFHAGCDVIILRRKIGGGRLYDAYRVFFKHGAFCDPELQMQLVDRTAERQRLKSDITEREQEVLVELVYGHTNAEISKRLGLQETTVKHHMHNLMQKLSVNNRAHLASRCLRLGLCSWGLADNGPPTFIH